MAPILAATLAEPKPAIIRPSNLPWAAVHHWGDEKIPRTTMAASMLRRSDSYDPAAPDLPQESNVPTVSQVPGTLQTTVKQDNIPLERRHSKERVPLGRKPAWTKTRTNHDIQPYPNPNTNGGAGDWLGRYWLGVWLMHQKYGADN